MNQMVGLTILNQDQAELLEYVIRHPGENTRHITFGMGRGNRYQTMMRGRLYSLANAGLLRYSERRGTSDVCVERNWYPLVGLDYLH